MFVAIIRMNTEIRSNVIDDFILRDFIEQQYVKLKQNNPNFPVLIRECSSIEPKLYARYGEDGDFVITSQYSLSTTGSFGSSVIRMYL